MMQAQSLSRRALLYGVMGASITLSACASLTGVRHDPLAQIIRRNTRARGGAEALDRMRALQIDVEIMEGATTLNGRYAANVAGLVRIDIYADGKLVHGEGVDRQGVWIMGKDGPQPSIATGAANALTNGAENHLFGWHRFAERGHKLALMPSATIEGVTYSVVEVRYSTGHVSYFYVDPFSGQAVRRRDERAYHPDVRMTKQKVETRFFDFLDVAGLVASHRSEDVDLASGKVIATNRVLARRINPALPENYFDRARHAAAVW